VETTGADDYYIVIYFNIIHFLKHQKDSLQSAEKGEPVKQTWCSISDWLVAIYMNQIPLLAYISNRPFPKNNSAT
jgi:hypothetical protein